MTIPELQNEIERLKQLIVGIESVSESHAKDVRRLENMKFKVEVQIYDLKQELAKRTLP